MGLFNRKSSLSKRVKALEYYLGVVYDADVEWVEEMKTSALERIRERLEKIEEKGKK